MARGELAPETQAPVGKPALPGALLTAAEPYGYWRHDDGATSGRGWGCGSGDSSLL
jgi:hypothetical protein